MGINYENGTNYTRGLKKIDERFGMPGKRELIILFGYMSSGKTEFAYFVARKNAALGNKVLFISLELPEYDMKLRLARKRAGISKYAFQKGQYNDAQKHTMDTVFAEIESADNIIIDSPEKKDLGTIMERIRLGYDRGYRMVIVDNLDKIRGGLKEDENTRYQRITTTFQDFKNENEMNIILLHHAKKPDTKFGGYRPAGMSGMRGSQKIMDNATQVIEIYRDLDPDSPAEERNKVTLYQMKDTFEGSNGIVGIFFGTGTYLEENPNAVL